VLAIDDVEASARTAALVRKQFPHLEIQARARNRIHALELRAPEVKVITRETFAFTFEMAESTLVAAGLTPEVAGDTVARFRRHDEDVLERQYAVHRDEDRLVQTSPEVARELEGLFDSDQSDGAAAPPEDDPLDLARGWG